MSELGVSELVDPPFKLKFLEFGTDHKKQHNGKHPPTASKRYYA